VAAAPRRASVFRPDGLSVIRAQFSFPLLYFFFYVFSQLEFTMSHLHHTVLAIALVTAAIGSGAQTAATGQPSSRQAASATTPCGADQTAAMDRQIKAMREVREKMANAKTTEERNALIAEQMKAMQDGMATMNMMGGPGMGCMGGMQGGKPIAGDMNQRQQMLEKRMEMMQSTMQMMMDRLPPPAAK
jgi:hypothetical protein